MMALDLDCWKTAIGRRFSGGPPNGWVLGWDRTRMFAEICREAKDYSCTNCTSFDYSFCNRYEIRVDESSYEFWNLTVRISFVLDVFSLHWTRYVAGGKRGWVLDDAPNQEASLVELRIRDSLESKGYDELPADWYEEPIDGVVLELSGDRATIGKCLFEDHDS